MNDATTEEKIQAAGLTAPRLTPGDIDEAIAKEQFHVFDGTCLTVCCLTVTGESACASPENFNEKIGRDIAYDDARQKIWALEGYLLKQTLYDRYIA